MSYRFGQPQNIVVTLSASDILNMSVTPVTLVPTPGMGFFIYPLRIVLINLPGGIFYGGLTASDTFTSWGPNSITDRPDQAANPFGQSAAFAWQFDNLKGPGDANQVSMAANQPLLLNASATFDAGALLTAHVGVGGTGYAPGDTGTVNSSSGAATYQVTTAPGGVVSAVTIPSGGTLPATADYVVGQTYPTSVSTGGGDGALTLVADTTTHGNGTGKVYVEYIIYPTT